MEDASGRAATVGRSVAASLRALATGPRAFLVARPVGLVLLVYGGTYGTANAVDTWAATAGAVSAGAAKFAWPSAANVGLGVVNTRVRAALMDKLS